MVLVAALLLVSPGEISRDEYGVPHIQADSWREAFFLAGKAVAQDRMWQMEQSRLLARGKAAEFLGDSFAAADREQLRFGYSDAELEEQFNKLPANAKQAFESYAEGINSYLSDNKALPQGYAANGFSPRPWTTSDSVAISIKFLQQFGRGGAGEIRNMALHQYLSMRPNLKGKVLDVLDDFAWQNDQSATTTVQAEDLPKGPYPVIFPSANRATTEAHIAALPKLSLLELIPGTRVAMKEDSTLAAERVSAPYKVGSYCVVVSPKRSRNDHPILLSAPQMGFRNPCIVHEMSLKAPGLDVIGMDLPGVPGILIGHTPDVAWGLTTGVADTEDIAFGKPPTTTESKVLKVKGKEEEVVQSHKTDRGPVIIRSKSTGVDLVRVSSFYKRELESMSVVFDLYQAKTASQVQKTVSRATMNFNFFFATKNGDIGYQYGGLIPIRKPGFDPRFPVPYDSVWTETLPKALMPQVTNPKSGLLANWNNKPVSWWSNGDTPVWGHVFRDKILRNQLTKTQFSTGDVERAAWTIARTNNESWAFEEVLRQLPDTELGKLLKNYDGNNVEGSLEAQLFTTFLEELKKDLFEEHIGNLMDPNNFRQAAQPSVVLKALARKTKFDFLKGRSTKEILVSALARAEKALAQKGPFGSDAWRFKPGAIQITGQVPIPYSDRGTYIQVVELGPTVFGRNVLPPGVAEEGPHSQDQVPLSRSWTYKPMKSK